MLSAPCRREAGSPSCLKTRVLSAHVRWLVLLPTVNSGPRRCETVLKSLHCSFSVQSSGLKGAGKVQAEHNRSATQLLQLSRPVHSRRYTAHRRIHSTRSLSPCTHLDLDASGQHALQNLSGDLVNLCTSRGRQQRSAVRSTANATGTQLCTRPQVQQAPLAQTPATTATSPQGQLLGTAAAFRLPQPR